MPQYVGMGDEGDLNESDEFKQAQTTDMVHSQGKQRDTARQQHIMRVLTNSGSAGATAREMVDALKVSFDPAEYHGPVSGAMTKMRDAGLIKMLTSRRARFHVYVLPEHVDGRPTKEKEGNVFGTKKSSAEAEEIARLKNDLENANRQAEQVSARNAELVTNLRARDIQVDNLLEASTRQEDEARKLRANFAALEEQYDSDGQHYRTVLAERDRLKESEQNLRERAEDAEAALVQAPKATPRKTITDGERRVLEAVAKAIHGRGDGTKDKPERITLKVATVRTLGAALQRVISD